jgi:hypothetical protein
MLRPYLSREDPIGCVEQVIHDGGLVPLEASQAAALVETAACTDQDRRTAHSLTGDEIVKRVSNQI